jgi:putative two-component system response regulator
MQKQVRAEQDAETDPVEELLEEAEVADQIPVETETTRQSVVRLPGELADFIRLCDNPNLAVLVLDSNLIVIHHTRKIDQLFRDYYVFGSKPFFNIFYPALDQKDINELRVSLKNIECGYSWTGTLRHKTPSTRTMFTKTNIIPIFCADRSIAGYSVIFEDITGSYNDQLQSTFKSILEAAKLKDNDTGLHDERVGYYCKKMAEYLYETHQYPQIDPDFIENIVFLAAMHDVGKIGTPDYILQKPGKLTDQEWEIMREHTINGAFILSSYPVTMAKDISLSHHEWWNGAGYPFKLEGLMIPLAARIVTIADVYDALRMKRTYKEELTHEEAARKIIAGKGTQFDPNLVDAFEHIQGHFDEIWNLLKDAGEERPVNRDRSQEFSASL